MRKLPDDWTKALFADRKIVLIGRIDADAQELISAAIVTLNSTSRDPIKLYIDSNGGELDPELYLADLIRASNAPIHGIVTGVAYSAAFALLQACQVRKGLLHSNFMFHAPAGTTMRVDTDDLEDIINNMRLIHEEQIREYSKRSKLSEVEWRKWSKEEKKFRAPEALEHGIIDEIVSHI